MARTLRIVNEDDFKAPPLTGETTNSFGFDDRLFLGFRDGAVFDYGDMAARDIQKMLSEDYRARQLENVMALPVLSATWDIVSADTQPLGAGKSAKKSDSGQEKAPAQVKNDPGITMLKSIYQGDELSPNSPSTSLDKIIGQLTSAFSYRRTFHEKTWVRGVGDFDGKYVYGNVGFRPQTTCRVLRHPRTGRVLGFEQDPFTFDPDDRISLDPVRVWNRRALVYIHNQRLDPLNGSSDLEVAYWAWKSKQKLLFLWFQFLEGVSLPRVVVKTPDQDLSNRIAAQVAKLKSSGILPISTDGSSQGVEVSPLDVSGKGSEEFTKAIEWLDNAAADSVLAGFLNLTGGTGNGGQAGGSLALAKDASDFFLQNEEAKTREIEDVVRQQLFAPLIRANFGPSAPVPRLRFEPLNTEDKSASVSLLQALLSGQAPEAIPTSFISALAAQVASYLGIDIQDVEGEFQKAADEAKKKAEAMQQQIAQGGNGPNVAHVAQAAGVIGKASDMVDKHKKALEKGATTTKGSE